MKHLEISALFEKYHEENKNLYTDAGIYRKWEHAHRVADLIQHYPQHLQTPHPELAYFLALHHDDGRARQFKLTGALDDRKMHHCIAGERHLQHFIEREGRSWNSCPRDILILRDVLRYHGDLEGLRMSSQWIISLPYVKAITAADTLDNALSCVSYLKRNVYNDEKGLLSYKHVANFVWEHYEQGKKFDKIKHCKTYSEYIIFAATLATFCIKEYEDLTRELLKSPGFGYPSILEGYKDNFFELLSKEDAQRAYEILYNAVYNIK